jgi:hypothetical protein
MKSFEERYKKVIEMIGDKPLNYFGKEIIITKHELENEWLWCDTLSKDCPQGVLFNGDYLLFPGEKIIYV